MEADFSRDVVYTFIKMTYFTAYITILTNICVVWRRLSPLMYWNDGETFFFFLFSKCWLSRLKFTNAYQNDKQGRPWSNFFRNSLIWVRTVWQATSVQDFRTFYRKPYFVAYVKPMPLIRLTGPRSAVGNVSGNRCQSDCRSSCHEFYPCPVPYFRGDWSWNNFYGHSPSLGWIIQEGLLSVTRESMCTKYWLTACSSHDHSCWVGM